MDSSFRYSILPSAEAMIPTPKVAVVLSGSYPSSRIFVSQKRQLEEGSKLHTPYHPPP